MTDIANFEMPEEAAVTNSNVAVFGPRALQAIQQFAEVMASGKATVPKHLAGSVADCMAVTMQAVQWRMNPFAVAQKTHVVNGTLGYEAQLVNAVVTSSNAIKGHFHYEYSGDWKRIAGMADKRDETGLSVRVGAILRGETEITWGEPLYLTEVMTRNSPLWKSKPQQQIAYLAVKYFARLYCPEVILGVYTPDELEDKPRTERDVTPARSTGDLNNLINAKQPIDAPQEPQKKDERQPDELLADFTTAAGGAKSVEELDKFYKYSARKLAAHHDQLEKATDVYQIRKAEMTESQE